MKEILFEAKTTDGKWVQGLPTTMIESEFSNFNAMMACGETGYWGVKHIIPETLAQYVGHTTEDGTRVFDKCVFIDPDNREYYVTEWNNENSAFVLRELSTDRIVMMKDMLDIFDGTFVPHFVGRAYDNPDLFIKKEDI